MPLHDGDGAVVGSLCAIDGRVRAWTDAELDALADLAAACSSELVLRRTVEDLTRARTALEGSAARLAALSQAALALGGTFDVPALMRVVVEQGLAAVGCAGGAVAVLDPLEPDVILSVMSRSFGGLGADQYGRLPLTSPLPVGVVARTGRAVLLPDRAACEAFPQMAAVVEATGASAFACLPMVVEGRVVGVLSAGWAEARAFDADEVELLEAFAAQCALALARIRERDAERLSASRQAAMAEALQRSLLADVAQPEGLRVAARYRASGAEAQVGGDWYDAFVVPTGALTLVVGDVTGHDQQAAAVMGQLRNLLRGVSHVVGEPPAAVLARLDLVMRDLGVGAFATAVLASVEPAAGSRGGPGGSSPGPTPGTCRPCWCGPAAVRCCWRRSRTCCWASTPAPVEPTTRSTWLRAPWWCCTPTAWWSAAASTCSAGSTGSWRRSTAGSRRPPPAGAAGRRAATGRRAAGPWTRSRWPTGCSTASTTTPTTTSSCSRSPPTRPDPPPPPPGPRPATPCPTAQGRAGQGRGGHTGRTRPCSSRSVHRSSGTGAAKRTALRATCSAVRIPSVTSTTAGWRSGNATAAAGSVVP